MFEMKVELEVEGLVELRDDERQAVNGGFFYLGRLPSWFPVTSPFAASFLQFLS